MQLDTVTLLSSPNLHVPTPAHGQPRASSVLQRHSNDTQSIPALELTQATSPDNDVMNESSNTHLEVSQPTRRHRKSRYMSLPSEVDASLNVLYRELESTASLRLEAEKLRSENLRLLQTIKIRDLSLISLRRELEHQQFSNEEFETLRKAAAQLENSSKELQEYRAKTEELEVALQNSRAEATESKALLSEWKTKLSQLIDN